MSIHLAASDLREMLRAVSFAAPNGDHLPALQGIRIHTLDGRLHLAATDGHRIARTSRPVKGDGFSALTLTSKDVPALYAACRTSSNVVLSPANGGFAMTGGPPHSQARFAHTAHDDQFPTDYERVIPATWDAAVHFEIGPTGRVLYQLTASVLFQEASLIRLQKDRAGRLEVAPYRGPGGPLAKINVCPGRWPAGSWPDRAINAVYLLDAITAAPGTGAVLRMCADPSTPIGVFAPDDPAWACVTMPVRDGDGPGIGLRTLH